MTKQEKLEIAEPCRYCDYNGIHCDNPYSKCYCDQCGIILYTGHGEYDRILKEEGDDK